MPHVKGTPRAPGSGRKKGTPNKARALMIEIATKALGKEPMHEMCQAYLKYRDTEPAVAGGLIKAINAHCYPMPKAVEVTGADGEPLSQSPPLTTEERIALARAVREAKA